MDQHTQYKIMIVDDEKDFRDEMAEYLGRERPNWTDLSSVLCKLPHCRHHRYFSILSPKWIES